MDFGNMEVADAKRLVAAMTEESSVTPADLECLMAAFYKRMDPTQPAISCGSCGKSDVPVSAGGPDPASIGIESFTLVGLSDPVLNVLRLTDAENRVYQLPLPEHMLGTAEVPNPLDTEHNRMLWRQHYGLVRSVVEVARAGCLAPARDNTVPLPDEPIPLPDGAFRLFVIPSLVEPDNCSIYLCSRCNKALSKNKISPFVLGLRVLGNLALRILVLGQWQRPGPWCSSNAVT
jgi:hypothetical protein